MADNARIQELRRRVQQDPATLAFAPLAEELRRAGRTAEAIRVCESGLALHPQYLSARATLGRALLESGDLDSALIELTTVLGAAPQNLAALRGVAEIRHRRGEIGDALVQYRMALALSGRDPELERAVQELERLVSPEAATPVTDESSAPPGEPSPLGDQPRETVRQLERFLAAVLDDRDRRAAGGR